MIWKGGGWMLSMGRDGGGGDRCVVWVVVLKGLFERHGDVMM